MDRITYNNIRLKAYYWEKQILRGRDDDLAVSRFQEYSEKLEAAKEALAAQKEDARQARLAAKEKEALAWRKNVKRRSAPNKGYDSWTLKALETSLKTWQPTLEVVFDS